MLSEELHFGPYLLLLCLLGQDSRPRSGDLLTEARNYLNSSGLIVMNNAIISPITTPVIVPAATPRQNTFCSLVVISTFQRHGKPYHIPGRL